MLIKSAGRPFLNRMPPMRYHAEQAALWNSPYRFDVVPSGRRCLALNTQVNLADGKVVNVQDVKKGDEVLSINVDNYILEKKLVLHIYDNGVKPVFEITTENGFVLLCTCYHPVLTQDGFIEAEDLRRGMKLLTYVNEGILAWSGFVSFKFVGDTQTFDLTVEGNHNFISNGIVTHNSGKTEIVGKRRLLKRMLLGTKYDDARFAVCAPTHSQAKRIYWRDLKKLIDPYYIIEKREAELMIRLINNSEIHVIGMDKPERVEGTPWDGIVLDEYANMKKETWYAHVRPALADRKGWCSFIGVPEGRNHYYDLYKNALSDTTGEWGVFKWHSADILDKEEIKQARKDLDELTFNQEFLGDFVSFSGRAYYSFDEKYHCDKLYEEYDKKKDLIFCFDFNVSPGVAVICQEFPLYGRKDELLAETLTAVIGEVYIKRNSNTEIVCNKLCADWKEHEGKILCYGDATGGNRGSAKLQGSDWDIIERILCKQFGEDRVRLMVTSVNPRERDRVNAVNSRLKNTENEIHLMVDPRKAPMLVKDFEGVCVVEGGSGEIDKRAYPELSHASDSVGYYCDAEFPVTGKRGGIAKFSGF